MKFRKLMKEFILLLGRFNVGTFILRLSWVDHFSGLNAKADKIAKQNDEFLEQTVEEHLDSQKREGNDGEKVECREDFVDVLLGIYKDIKTTTGFSIDRDSIKSLILASPLNFLSLEFYEIVGYSDTPQCNIFLSNKCNNFL